MLPGEQSSIGGDAGMTAIMALQRMLLRALPLPLSSFLLRLPALNS